MLLNDEPSAGDGLLVISSVPLISKGLRGVLSSGMEDPPAVHEAPNVIRARERMEQMSDRLALVIVGPLAPNETQYLHALREDYPRVPMCLLIEHFDHDTVMLAHTLDVIGFIHMGATPLELVEAVGLMMDGKVYLPRSARPYLDGIEKPPTSAGRAARSLAVSDKRRRSAGEARAANN